MALGEQKTVKYRGTPVAGHVLLAVRHERCVLTLPGEEEERGQADSSRQKEGRLGLPVRKTSVRFRFGSSLS